MKTMKINELVSELIGFGGESTVKVWSNGADNAYPISHVGQGHTDGVLDTYVSIVVDDDRNLVDLSKIWHDASEMPKEGEWILVQYDEDCYDTLVLCDLLTDIFYARCKKYGDIRWAYISDLLLKGGEK